VECGSGSWGFTASNKKKGEAWGFASALVWRFSMVLGTAATSGLQIVIVAPLFGSKFSAVWEILLGSWSS
jgi:hypothetical protein